MKVSMKVSMISWLHPPIISVMARAIPHPMADRLSFVMTSWTGFAASERIDPRIDPHGLLHETPTGLSVPESLPGCPPTDSKPVRPIDY
jgi:hypothetical protein